jgi:peptide deformylase
MSVLPVYSCFHPILKQSANPVENIDDSIRRLVNDMFETMSVADGVGLAGNQVGKLDSIVVIDTTKVESAKNKLKVALINPEIISQSDEITEYQEGCLSVPTLYEYVKRPKQVQVRFYDINGKEIVIEDDDFFARVVEHELDHLKGILFFERLSPLRRTFARKTLKKIQNGSIVPDYQMILK